jgi:predicted alpha-1,2-mannosidase
MQMKHPRRCHPVWPGLLFALCLCDGFTARTHGGVSDQIDPFFGTCGGGDTIIGPSLPFAMIKPGPDVGKNDQNSGWAPEGDINGFSQTHVSGTGGGNKYGNILVQPTTGPVSTAGYGSPRKNERATIGFYGVKLARYGIDAEVTAAERAALYRFTYPQTDRANILFDVSHCLVGGAQYGENQSLVASSVEVLSSNEVTGFSRVTGGWNLQTNAYTVYFYAVTDTPADESGTWRDGTLRLGGREQSGGAGERVGAWLAFESPAGRAVRLKMGISFVSIARAKANALKLAGFDFEGVRAAAAKAWDTALEKVQVRGATPQQQKLFYTSLYHAMLMPVDRSGDNPLWESKEPYYDDFYAIWDTFRCSSPLLTLVAQERQTDIVRSLVDMYRHEGWIPDARSGNYNGRTQGGSDADILMADAYVKKLPGVDWATAYAALVKNAEVSPVDQFKEGRGGLDDWHTLGYLSIEGVDRPGSKQMEYAADDFAVATLARGLGRPEDSAKYLKRSRNWENLWNTNFEVAGFKGFIQPRHRDGSWKADFSASQGCSWHGDTFYEGDSWVYSFFVPQDMPGLIEKCGGREQFVKRLDAFFNGRFDVSNEPGFLVPYLYAWAGRQDKTCDIVREIVTKRFQPSPGGLPGNDDSGAMSSWYVFSALGFFPVAGQDLYVIGSPLFPSATLQLAGGKSFTIEARETSATNKYVVSATLNGRPITDPWLRHEDIVNGGTLVLNMGPTPGGWGQSASQP